MLTDNQSCGSDPADEAVVMVVKSDEHKVCEELGSCSHIHRLILPACNSWGDSKQHSFCIFASVRTLRPSMWHYCHTYDQNASEFARSVSPRHKDANCIGGLSIVANIFFSKSVASLIMDPSRSTTLLEIAATPQHSCPPSLCAVGLLGGSQGQKASRATVMTG